ncbi:MAG: hypothetical protein M1823_006430 [Watsoniomyces obsoletus]|nr:MAG: hypothetical protein M1823_006430 [Watsoniomyces obsoletus]
MANTRRTRKVRKVPQTGLKSAGGPKFAKPAQRTKVTAKKTKAKKAPHRATGVKTVPGGKTVTTADGRVLPATTGQVRMPKRKRRAKPGNRALREIKRFQTSTELLLPKAPFQRLVREIADYERHEIGGTVRDGVRFNAVALGDLQEAAEAFLVSEFEMTNLLALHGKRVTIQAKDMQLVEQLRKMMTGKNYREAP